MQTRVIAVTGGKGGVGKSSMAANLATYYATRGSQVLLLDADLGMADMNLLLGVAPEKSLLDVLDGEPAERVLVEAHGLHLLPACNASTRLANIDEAERQVLLTQVDALSDRFDTLIVDCAAGIGQNSVAFAAAAADIVVVVSPDPTSLADAYACIKVLHKEYQVQRLCLLPNGMRTPTEGQTVVHKLMSLANRFLDVALVPLPSVPFDPHVRAAGAAGIPFVLSAPDGPAARAMAQVCRQLDRSSGEDDRAGAIRLFWKRALTQRVRRPRPLELV